MIKSAELMIGDYVLVEGKPRRVESITKKKIGYHINPQTDKRLYYARLHDVEPIEITEDLLQKIGFWKEPKLDKIFSCADNIDNVYAWDASYYIGNPSAIRISSHTKYAVGGGDATIDPLVLSTSCLVVAKYLHELQHAFGCCKIFFTIKL
jgi:hypothetical protein